ARLAHDFPAVNSQRGLRVVPFETARTGDARQISWIMMGMMLFVLLIACVNLANLQLARTASRTREHAVRMAVGASRGHLIRQLLAESVLLSVAGGALGLLVAAWGNKLLGSRLLMGSDTPGFALPLDLHVLCFTLAASVGTGIVFGLTPALIASRTDVNAALKQGPRGSSADRSKNRVRHILVVSELALALLVLSGAAFFARGVMRIVRQDRGWQYRSLVTGNFVLSYTTYANNDQVRAVVDRLTTELSQLPGTERVAIAGSVPTFSLSHRANLVIDGQPMPQGKEPLALAERVTPGYFQTLGISLLGGRDFSGADRAGSKEVVIINRSMADKFWPKGDAIGHRIGDAGSPNPQWREIVGIVNDIQFPMIQGGAATLFQVYRPMTQDPEHWLAFALHGMGDPAALARAARIAVAKVDPDLAVYSLGTVASQLGEAQTNIVLVVQILSIAAVLGLFLALIGIYGVVANLAAQRTQEIGIRMALGAQPSAVLWLILRNGARLAAIGTGIGLVLAFALGRVLSLSLPFIDGKDPLLIVTMAAMLVAATLLACLLPALRATRVNPVEALRAD
ncbi:MAG TPA: FtsX-like permease family protein, partial [Opitutaceae bacterium]